jgi:hypothetical protein
VEFYLFEYRGEKLKIEQGPINGASPYIRTPEATRGRLYRVSQEEWSIFGEVIISAILSKKVCMYTCPIPKGFRDRGISLYTAQCTDEQHAMSSHELQSALTLTVGFSKMFYIR